MRASDEDRQRDGTAPGVSGSWWTRHRRATAGVAGLAAVLGAGAYVLTDQMTADRTTTRRDAAISAVTNAPTAGPSGTPVASSSSAPPAATASASPIPSKVVEEIKEARRKMAEDGVEVKRPAVPKATATADDVRVATKGSLSEGGIVRMVTARGDLTGQRELAWVAGGVAKYRNVPCSQTIRFSANSQPEKKPNLLMCWRTSAKKSVVAIVVDPKGHPSREKAVDALEQKWRSMR